MKFDDFLIYARRPDSEVGYENPQIIPCPRCDGELLFTGLTVNKTFALLECNGKCRFAYGVRSGKTDY